jgi:gluconokinase
MWSDKRSSADADALASEINAIQTHNRTGCRLHSSYWPAKLRWLHRTRSDVVGNVATWCGLADWIARAPGTPVTTSVSMASATGMSATEQHTWDETLAQHLNLEPRRLPAIVDRTDEIPADEIHPDFLPAGLNARWYPAIGDGAAANIGASAVGDDRIALTIGTSGAIRLVRPISETPRIPPSLFRYLVDADTEVIGGALSNGGNMMSWLASFTELRDPKASMDASAKILPDNHGLTVLPFFAGERAPSWQDSLGGTITGMSLDTSPAHVHRALLEATALRFASVYDAVRLFADDQHEIVANGGALLQAPLWMQITADALGHEIRALPARMEASARGAAIAALQAAGILPSLRTDIDARKRFSPDTAHTAVYRKARARQDALERALTHWEQEHS